MRELTSKGSWHKILKSKLSFKPSEPGYKAWCKDHHLEWASYIGIHGNHSGTGTSFNWAGPMCKKIRGPYGLAWRMLMTRAHILRKENFVSSKARVLNHLNKRMVAPGAEVRAQFKQMYKMHQSWPKKKKKEITSLLFPPNFLVFILRPSTGFEQTAINGSTLAFLELQLRCAVITLLPNMAHNIQSYSVH